MLNNKVQTINPLTSARILAADQQNETKYTELLMTSVPPPDKSLSITHISQFNCALPLKTRGIEWPKTTNSLCLHCAGPCTRGPPVPAVKYYDSQQQQYWVLGPFCCASCSFGYICENGSSSKQMAATHTILRDFFNIPDVHIAPPRASHQRFGGPMDDTGFYKYTESTTITEVLEPPFVTFAHYVVAKHQSSDASEDSKKVSDTYDLLPQSAGKLTSLVRPAERKLPLAQKMPTGQSPLLLEYLAAIGKDDQPKKKQRAETDDITVRSNAAATTNSNKGFLARYVKN